MIKDIIFDFFGTLVNYDHDLNSKEFDNCREFLAGEGFVVEHSQFITAFWSAFEELEDGSKTDYREFQMIEVAQLNFRRQFDINIKPEIANDLIFQFMESWGKGIGSELIGDCMDWFKCNSVKRIKDGVAYGHEAAFQFYEKFGLFPRLTYLTTKNWLSGQ